MEVDYPRVTHPFAGLLTLAGFLPRLACVRHAASVRSEPGSNSPINLAGDMMRTRRRRVIVSPENWSVSSCADVTTNSLKALRFPQSLSWTCYPVFKDRTPLPACGRPTADPAFSAGARFLPLSALRVKALRSGPIAAPQSAGGASCNIALPGCQAPGFSSADPSAPPCSATGRRGSRQTR